MGRPLGLGLATLAILLGLGGMYLASLSGGSQPRGEGDPAPSAQRVQAPPRAGRPPGEAKRPLHPKGPPRSPSLPALQDPEAWRERRVLATAGWRERELAAVERFAEERGLAPEVRAELLAIEEQMFESMAAARSNLERGNRKARDELIAARNEAREAIIALLGEQDAHALQAELATMILQ